MKLLGGLRDMSVERKLFLAVTLSGLLIAVLAAVLVLGSGREEQVLGVSDDSGASTAPSTVRTSDTNGGVARPKADDQSSDVVGGGLVVAEGESAASSGGVRNQHSDNGGTAQATPQPGPQSSRSTPVEQPSPVAIDSSKPEASGPKPARVPSVRQVVGDTNVEVSQGSGRVVGVLRTAAGEAVRWRPSAGNIVWSKPVKTQSVDAMTLYLHATASQRLSELPYSIELSPGVAQVGDTASFVVGVPEWGADATVNVIVVP
ncbi:hypothetical protein CR970_00450 [Candidatus Saccharibacteria bacterium]|nr:MAG: hypothetical protein CR970_00450 [Candidatus Saccharibacteria bacterium]